MKNNIKSSSKGNFTELIHCLKCLALRACVADELNQPDHGFVFVNYLFVCALLFCSSVSWRRFSFGFKFSFKRRNVSSTVSSKNKKKCDLLSEGLKHVQ